MSEKVQRTYNRISLVGFSGTGKTSVARLVADMLDWDVIDIDSEIEKIAGKQIRKIFAEDGEAAFRALESRALSTALKRDNIVLATGGGIMVDPENKAALLGKSIVVCLEALPETIYRRLVHENEADSSTVRPLLDADEPLERVRELKQKRQHYYAGVHWTVQTDMLSHEEVCREVLRGWQTVSGKLIRHDAHGDEYIVRVNTSERLYPVFIGWGIIDTIAVRLKEAGITGTVVIITDDTVYSYHGKDIIRSLETAGFTVFCHTVSPGEKSKTIRQAVEIYDYLVEKHIERGDAIVALGGGMIDDLAGFVAATYLRGVSLIQVPTSLLAMTDAGIGGKVAVDHKKGKNLIGAFYQPRFVLCDVSLLKTLPKRELTSGWAEVVKYGAAFDDVFFDFLRKNCTQLLSLERRTAIEAVYHSVRIKGQIVSEDEKETGRRILLNFGHTIAHGLETASSYGTFLHGEAVAIGMNGAAMLSSKLGLLSVKEAARLTSLLKKFGLPVRCSGVPVNQVKKAMQLDKKIKDKAIRWVLLDGLGNAVVRRDVPDSYVDEVLNEVIIS